MADSLEGGVPVHVAGTASGEIFAHAEAINGGRRWLLTARSRLPLLVRIEFEAVPEQVVETDIPHPGGRGYAPEHWQRVIELWREAQQVAPRAPLMWIARQTGRSEATVGRWLRTLRKRGLLTDTTEPSG